MGEILDAVANFLPHVFAGASANPQVSMAMAEQYRKQEKEKNLRAFGKEMFGSGDPTALTPEKLYATAQKYNVSPEEATGLTMNFLSFKKQMRGDPRLVSVPMPDGRFRSADVYESEMPKFMEQNPGAVQGQVYGQKNDPMEPYRIQEAQAKLKYMPAEIEAGLKFADLSNRMKELQLEGMSPEKEAKTVSALNEIFRIPPAELSNEKIFSIAGKHGLTRDEIKDAMTGAANLKKTWQGKSGPDTGKMMQYVKDAYNPLMESASVSGPDAAAEVQRRYQEDLRRAYAGETPSIFEKKSEQTPAFDPKDPLGIRLP